MDFLLFAARRLLYTPLLLAALSLALLMAILGSYFLSIFLLSFLALPIISWWRKTMSLWREGQNRGGGFNYPRG